MKMQFTNETIISTINAIMNEELKGYKDGGELSCALCYASTALRNKVLREMNILTQSAFEISYRFDALLKAIITSSPVNNIDDTKEYIKTNVLEVSRLIDWTETSEIMAMDYLVSKEMNG